MSGAVHIDTADRVATLTIANTEKRNALGPPLIAKIVNALEDLQERDDIRCLIITGEGENTFSSGFDISYQQRNFGGGGEGPAAGSEADFIQMVERIRHIEYPVIARINGGTFGGSVYLITACDLRIAVNEARFGITPAKLGVIYDAEAIGEIMAHIGPGNTKELLFTADFIDAERAYDMGLLNDVVPRAELDDRTYGMAETIANNAPLSLSGMKRIVRTHLNKTSLTDTEVQWAKTLEQQAKDSRDHREGVEAFMENRDPEFEGR